MPARALIAPRKTESLAKQRRAPRRVARTLATAESLVTTAEDRPVATDVQHRPSIESARRVLGIEAAAIASLAERIDESFDDAVRLLLACEGRVVVSGIGKSGHIARKTAATLASTGTPAFFLHAAEASHGDLGMVAESDCVVAFSNSGETDELLAIVPFVKRRGAKLIAITGQEDSTLASLADVHIDAHVDQEACSLNLAPTASTTAALALGDALAIALLDARGFGEDDFARAHPGGTLGRRLLTHVRDIMRTGDAVPVVRDDASLSSALLEISKKGMAMTAVVSGDDRVEGIFTDGDLRRLIEKTQDFGNLRVADVMHRAPRTIGPDRLAAEAADLMEEHRINQLLVIDADGRIAGALHIHDLTHAKVI